MPQAPRPEVPVVGLDPASASGRLLQLSRGACAFVLEPARAVIFIRADCPALREYLRTGDLVALAIVPALIAYENPHVSGAGEKQARQIEMGVFAQLTARLHPNDRKRARLWWQPPVPAEKPGREFSGPSALVGGRRRYFEMMFA